jgi:ABC-type transport system involved in multi-copper enzyme maturation permease subunit
MSAVLTPDAPTPAAPALTGQVPRLKVTQARVIRSEWTKFISLRSTLYTLLTAVVLMIGIGAIFSAVTASQYHTFGAAQRASFNPIMTSLNGTIFAVVAFGVLGVLVMSGEYGTGMIRSSLTAVPRRLPVLWGKLAVFAGTIFTVSLVASFISFYLGQALLSSHHLNVAITGPGALRSVIGAALYVTVAGLLGVALGALFRNTAAGISTFAAVFFVIPPLATLLPASVGNHVTPYLPSNAGNVLWGGAYNVHNALSPWTGFGLLCGYAVVLIGAAAWRLRRADA